jgi:hypothetical protein
MEKKPDIIVIKNDITQMNVKLDKYENIININKNIINSKEDKHPSVNKISDDTYCEQSSINKLPKDARNDLD